MHARSLGSSLAFVLALAVAGCTGDDDPEPAAVPSSPSTPLASYATEGMVVPRGHFCQNIGEAAIEETLGGPPGGSRTYDNGDRARLTRQVTDVAHEYGCVFASADGTTARAWVFAPPVTQKRARGLVSGEGRGADCRVAENAPAFGEPSVAVTCETPERTTTSFHGLFGDAWLSCSLSVSGDGDPLERAGRWCVTVADAARLG